MALLRSLLALAGPFRGRLALLVVIGTAIAVTHLVQALAAAAVFAGLFTGGPVGVALLVLGATIVVRAGLALLRESVAQTTAAVICDRLRTRLLRHLADLGPGYLLTRRSGSVQAVVVDGVDGLQAYFARYLPAVLVAAVTVVGVGIVLAGIDPVVAAAVLLVALAIPTLPRAWDRLLARRGQEHWSDYATLHAEYVDASLGMTTLKSFGVARRHRDMLADKAWRLYRSTMGAMRISLVESGITALGIGLGSVLATGIAVIRVLRGDLAAVDLFAVLMLSAVAFRPFRDVTLAWHAGYLGVSASREITAVLATEPVVRDLPPRDLPPRDLPGPPGAGAGARRTPPEICFDRVSFTYPDRTVPAVDDLTLTVPSGRTVAVVGRSGAGKSTLVSLLLRWFDPQSGTIRVDGRDVRDLPLAELRERIAVVSQDVTLFHGSVADNLRLADPAAADDRLWAALADAGLADEIRRLPAGLNTQVGERGFALSGGQRQRIAIARALLAPAQILILDEATSAVDSDAEAAIRVALNRLRANRTTLTIAHRLSTVRGADAIAVLDGGRLVELGTHHELLAADGAYAALVSRQRVAVIGR